MLSLFIYKGIQYMKSKKTFKIITMVLLAVSLLLLIKSNITLSYEPRSSEPDSGLSLEINSDLVRSLYSKLTLIEDSLMSDKYKYAYFKMSSKEKNLTEEEKLYATIENLYSEDAFNIKEKDGVEKTVVKSEFLIDEAKKLFKDTDIEPKNMNFAISSCGIVSYLYTKETFELGFKKCNQNDKSITKLISAKKQGNYVILHIKSFYASYEKKKKEKIGKYMVYNYNRKDLVEKIEEDEEEKLEHLIEDARIDVYDFYFELQGEDYNLSKIVQV